MLRGRALLELRLELLYAQLHHFKFFGNVGARTRTDGGLGLAARSSGVSARIGSRPAGTWVIELCEDYGRCRFTGLNLGVPFTEQRINNRVI